jgi:hypothetical protein
MSIKHRNFLERYTMAEMPPVRVHTTWKKPLVVLRDTLPEDQGAKLIVALASLTPEQIDTFTQALQQPDQAIARLTAPTPQAGSAVPPALDRPVPYSIAGLMERVLDIAQVEPARARDLLQRALKLG